MKGLVFAAAALCLLLMAGVATANPGTSPALNGVEDIYTGYLPPPGFHVMDYMLFYDGKGINDDKGDRVAGTDVTMIADAVRLVYSSPIEILGGRAAWHAVVPLVHKDIVVPGAGINDTFSGVGDMYFSPLLVGWDLDPDLHIIAGLDMIFPTGEYHRENLADGPTGTDTINPNIGTHHYVFEPAFAVTKMFPDNGLVLDSKFMYDMHTREPDSNIRTGNQFHMDYAATVPVVDLVRAGINGYWFTSCEQDRLNGVKIDNSKEKVFAIGPMVRYDAGERTNITLKVQFEQEAHNRPEGSAFWIKFVHSF